MNDKEACEGNSLYCKFVTFLNEEIIEIPSISIKMHYIFILLAAVTSLACFTGFFPALFSEITSPKWWAENTISLVIFGIFISVLGDYFRQNREEKTRKPFEGWTLIVKGFGEETIQKIHHSEIERFFVSDFDQWKYVKSVVSNYCHIKTKNIAEAESRKWLHVCKVGDLCPESRKAIKHITIDFSKMTKEDITKWHGDKPDDWIG